MWRSKQNIILLGVLFAAIILLFGVKAYRRSKSNSISSNINVSMTEGILSGNRSIANPKVGDKQKSSEQDESSKRQAANTNIQVKSTNNLEDNAKDKINDTESIYIKAVGDIVLGRGVEYHLNNQGKDYTYPFQYVADILRAGNVVFGNLEVPMTESDHGLDPKGKYVIKSREKAVEGIKYAGFNVVNLANNHIMDYYEKGLLDTINVLEKNDIMHCGAGKNMDEAKTPAILDVKNKKIAVLGYTDMAEYVYKGNPMISFAAGEDKSGVAPRKYEFIKEDIEKIRESTDIIIVSLHWGEEDSFEVTEAQKEFAHNLINDGVDIILGHHPHKFQGVEIYEGKPIVYSMGNFIFDQNDPLKQESFIVQMEYANNKLISLELLPVRTISKTHIIIPKGEDAMELLKRELELCGKLGSKCAIVEDKIVFNIKQ